MNTCAICNFVPFTCSVFSTLSDSPKSLGGSVAELRVIFRSRKGLHENISLTEEDIYFGICSNYLFRLYHKRKVPRLAEMTVQVFFQGKNKIEVCFFWQIIET